ncbi:NAD(P)H-binding protein [Paenibacillus paeoniae]|uniref:SDR family NAD(P)-dependent oxidoreductase n=1 Tax=Paenibacillus paeoniae TaxID=2292705 RepID=A0A371PNH0_9BACL|nr:NAD(P)H-binding protein [Paenibacillus paeoniae]REK77673.1 SDR family NAD(P)-dependent oxidoreductase [Paenibacillus paeoniae]
MSIVITGASGKLGRLVIQTLLERVPGAELVASIRNMEHKQDFEKLGVAVRHCDYDLPDTLEQAFLGASRLLLISSSHHHDDVRLLQHTNVIEAAKRASVGHLLYTSFAFPEAGTISLTRLHEATERAVQASSIPYTIFRHALYTDFVGVLDLQSAMVKGELRVPPGEWRFNSVTRLDLATAIAATLTSPDHEQQTYELTAPKAWAFEELAEILSELADKPVCLLNDAQLQHWMFGFLRSINTSSTTGDLEQLMGRPATELREAIRLLTLQ